MQVTGWRGYLPWLDRQGRVSALRTAAFALVLVPALILVYEAWTHQLGSKPWTRAVHDTGTWTLRLLLITLAVSPLRRILDWGKLVGLRRMLGLSVLAYALAHLTLYCIDLAFDWGLIVSEIVKRFYLTIGFVAILGLVALGVTSTDGMIRRMGAPNWQRLHNLTYPIAGLGLLHFALQSKIDVTLPIVMVGLFALLMVYRGLNRWKIGLSWPVLAAAALVMGLVTALAEAGWYAFATGVQALTLLEANTDIWTYGFDTMFIRPGHWVALAGLGVALAGAVRGGGRQPDRNRERRQRLSPQTSTPG